MQLSLTPHPASFFIINNNILGFTSQNHQMIVKNAVGEGPGNFDRQVFFNNALISHSAQASTISPLSKCNRPGQNPTRDLRVSSRAP